MSSWRSRPSRRIDGALFAPMNRIPDTAKAALADRDRLVDMYASRTMEQLARELGCSLDAVRRALCFWGIVIRPPGAPLDWQPLIKPLAGIREQIRLAAWRAYRRLDRCPPDCPYMPDCFEEEDECAIEKMAGFRGENNGNRNGD